MRFLRSTSGCGEPPGARTRALWVPSEVDDVDSAVAFYTDQLGLSVVDGWRDDSSRGVVLRLSGG